VKRKLLILLSSFLLLLLAFWAYQLATRIDAPQRPTGTQAIAPDRDNANANQGLDLHVEMRDNQGRLQAVYDWPEWEKISDDRYRVTEPRVVLYREKGQRIYVWADSGVVQAERMARGYNIRSGTLFGRTSRSVKIFFDNSTDPDRKPPLERTEDEMRRQMIRFFTDRIDFDNQQLLIQTDSPVQMLSNQADVDGRGLHITWNEVPRELRRLRIDHGQRMVMYNVSDRDDPFSLGLSNPQPASAPAGLAASRPGPAETQPAPAGEDEPPAAASRPAEAPDGPRRPTSAPEVASRPAPPPAPAKRALAKPAFQRKNVYLAEFYENVRVRSGPRSLDGADKLTMEFEWAGQAENLFEGGRGSSATRPAVAPVAPAATPSTLPAAGPSDDAAAAPSPVAAPPSAPPGRPASAPATRPATRPVDRTVTITWSGPMVLTPIRYVPDPARGNYLVAGEGPKVVLKDDRNTAICRSFVMERHRDDPGKTSGARMKGQLLGTREQPARLLMDNTQEVACEDIKFDRIVQRAWLTGPGYMLQTHQGDKASTRPASRPARPAPDAVDRISWSDRVIVAFGVAPPREGQNRPSEYIQRVQLYGDVKLVQNLAAGPVPTSLPAKSDFVQSERMTIQFQRDDKTGEVSPQYAYAAGQARARQENTAISADLLGVSFARPQPTQKKPEPTTRRSARVQTVKAKPGLLKAEGNVVVVDSRDPGQPLRAVADQIISDPTKRTALLTGSDVRISQGPNVLSGTHVRLEEAGQVAFVTGPGSLDFLTDKDLNGARLSKPRPIRITWADSMDYAGTRNSAIFTGEVKLRSQTDQMDCRQMQVIFERTEPSTRPAKARPAATGPAKASVASSRPADRGPLAMAEYSSRRLSMILADGQVVLQTRRADEQQHLLRRVQLACEKLIYNAGAAQVDIVGGGTMLSEDYRPPQPKSKSAARTARPDDALSGNVDSPSQTAFRWAKSLCYMQEQRSINMDGDVLMVHRSGDQVVLADQVNRPDWPQPLPAGRRSEITCDRLLARFAEPPKPATRPATKPASRPATAPADDLDLGPRLGPLKLFHATGQVNMRDGTRQVLAQRLVYDRSTELDLAIIWGYLPGQPEADAHIYEEDPDKGTSRSWSSPKIIWDRKNDTITADKATGGGGR